MAGLSGGAAGPARRQRDIADEGPIRVIEKQIARENLDIAYFEQQGDDANLAWHQRTRAFLKGVCELFRYKEDAIEESDRASVALAWCRWQDYRHSRGHENPYRHNPYHDIPDALRKLWIRAFDCRRTRVVLPVDYGRVTGDDVRNKAAFVQTWQRRVRDERDKWLSQDYNYGFDPRKHDSPKGIYLQEVTTRVEEAARQINSVAEALNDPTDSAFLALAQEDSPGWKGPACSYGAEAHRLAFAAMTLAANFPTEFASVGGEFVAVDRHGRKREMDVFERALPDELSRTGLNADVQGIVTAYLDH